MSQESGRNRGSKGNQESGRNSRKNSGSKESKRSGTNKSGANKKCFLKHGGNRIQKPVFKQIFVRRFLVAVAVTVIISIVSTLLLANYFDNREIDTGSQLSAEFVKSMLLKRNTGLKHKINGIQYYASQEPYLYNRGVEVYYDGELIASSFKPAVYLTIPKKDKEHYLIENTAISTDAELIEEFKSLTPNRFGGELRFRNPFEGTLAETLTKFSFDSWQQHYNRSGSFTVEGDEVNYDNGTFTINGIKNYSSNSIEKGSKCVTLYDLPYPGDMAFEGGYEDSVIFTMGGEKHLVELYYTDYIYGDTLFSTTGILMPVIYTSVFVVSLIFVIVLSIIKYNTEKRLYDVYAYRSNITNVLAHDLKTPLMAIASYAENYEAASDNTKREHYVKQIRDNAFYMNDLIMNTLKYAKAESSEGIINKTNLDIKNTIEEILDGLTDGMKSKNITVDTSLSPKTISTDKIRFRNAISCLLENAVKYAPNGSVIAITQNSRGLFTIRNKVEDPIENISRLKEPYVRGNAARKEKDGTGLGLAIADKELSNLGFELLIEVSDGYFTATVK